MFPKSDSLLGQITVCRIPEMTVYVIFGNGLNVLGALTKPLQQDELREVLFGNTDSHLLA